MYNESTVSMRIRQLIFGVVFTLSVLGLTAMLIYSAGYSMDFKNWKLQPTGSIRVSVDPKDDVLILLLPTGDSSTSNQASFTHLLPGTYHLYVEAANYQSVNFELNVQPNSTVIIEPLRLWPLQSPEPVAMNNLLPVATTITDLSIALQSAVSQLGIKAENLKLLPINQHSLVLLDQSTHQVQLLNQTSNIVQTRQLGSAQDIQATGNADEILLVGQFDLQRVNIAMNNSETIIRLSKPINSAVWITATPYVAYSTDQSIHIIDSRLNTNYSDQVVAATDDAVTAIQYDLSGDELSFLSDQQAYIFPLHANK